MAEHGKEFDHLAGLLVQNDHPPPLTEEELEWQAYFTSPVTTKRVRFLQRNFATPDEDIFMKDLDANDANGLRTLIACHHLLVRRETTQITHPPPGRFRIERPPERPVSAPVRAPPPPPS